MKTFLLTALMMFALSVGFALTVSAQEATPTQANATAQQDAKKKDKKKTAEAGKKKDDKKKKEKKKPKEGEGASALSGALDRDHDGGILDNIGGF